MKEKYPKIQDCIKIIIPYSKFPKELKEDYLEVVYFEEIPDTNDQILFIVSHYELGLLGIKLKTGENITGIAENYTLKVKPTAKAKIYEPDEDLRERYLIRAVVEFTQKDQVHIIILFHHFLNN